MLDFFKSFSGIRASPPVWLEFAGDPPTVCLGIDVSGQTIGHIFKA
jgi:hypothetical protein